MSDMMSGGKLISRSELFSRYVYRIFSALALISALEISRADDKDLVLMLSILRLDRVCKSKLR